MEVHRQATLGTPLLTPDASGACSFFDRERSVNRCRVQREHGETMLPDACHHFPRRALVDDRGTFVTLSHFCPTAARLLFDDRPLSIVTNPVAFPETRAYDGLDARGHWPPLVRSNVLFDLDSYSRWEAFLVECCARAASPGSILERIASAAEQLHAWSISQGPFAEFLSSVLDASPDREASDALAQYRRFADANAYAHVLDAVPLALAAPSRVDNAAAAFNRWAAAQWGAQPAVRRYLAAKAFGSWAAYESRGVRTLVAELVMSEMVLRVEAARECAAAERPLDGELLHAAIRAADRLLVHLVDRPVLMEWLGTVEDVEIQN